MVNPWRICQYLHYIHLLVLFSFPYPVLSSLLKFFCEYCAFFFWYFTKLRSNLYILIRCTNKTYIFWFYDNPRVCSVLKEVRFKLMWGKPWFTSLLTNVFPFIFTHPKEGKAYQMSHFGVGSFKTTNHDYHLNFERANDAKRLKSSNILMYSKTVRHTKCLITFVFYLYSKQSFL